MLKYSYLKSSLLVLSVSAMVFTSCDSKKSEGSETADQDTTQTDSSAATSKTYLSQPLVTEIYTADPSAHVFEGKIYVYPSHDIDPGIPENDNGDHFDMRDYHIFSMDSVGGPVTDHGVALSIKDIPWAGRQLWAPDAAFANGKYYLYFPVKDKQDIFRIGVATSDKPYGPFKAEPKPMEGTYSIDPTVFKDTDGTFYLYLGGIWGGQLQRWRTGTYDSLGQEPKDNEPAIGARVARLDKNMLKIAEPLKEIKILDENGKEVLAGDHDKRFFEAAWLHKYNNKYYFTYSTGDTHFINYAIGDSPYGPFTYKGVVLNPVEGWTNHHSIVEHNGKWWLFYHDVQLSGKTPLRNIKVTELTHNPDGTIKTLTPHQ